MIVTSSAGFNFSHTRSKKNSRPVRCVREREKVFAVLLLLLLTMKSVLTTGMMTNHTEEDDDKLDYDEWDDNKQ